MEMMLFHTFRRPLILCPPRPRVPLESRFDGVYLDLLSDPDDLEASLVSFAPGDFLYLRLLSPFSVAPEPLASILVRTRSVETTVVSSSDPEFLRRLSLSGGAQLPRMAYRVTKKTSSGIAPPCPYDGIELPAVLATSARIREVHGQAKEVYVFVDSLSTRWGRRRGLPWLAHEKVDIVMTSTRDDQN